MAGLGQTTAKLARYKRQFERAVASAGVISAAQQGTSGSAKLEEVVAFGANPGNLRMLKYVPDDLPAGAPLVVVLHGCTQTAAGYDRGAGWSTLADRYGFALLFPEQQRSNNPNNCFNWFLPGDIGRGKGEVHSVQLMVEQALADHQLDRSRVFVTGLSAGGAMAAAMLAAYPDVFAGGAIVAGLPYRTAGSVQEALDAMYQGKSLSAEGWGDLVRSASPHRGPWPKVSIWHGTADSTVLPLNAGELVKQWTNVHGLTGPATAEETVDGHPRKVWRSPAGEAVVETYTIAGMGHGTPIAAAGPDGSGAAGPFMLETGISSSHRIAQFWGIADERVTPKTQTKPRATKAVAERARFQEGAPASNNEPTRAASSRPSQATPAPEPARTGGFDPGAIINKALRTAGLLKG